MVIGHAIFRAMRDQNHSELVVFFHSGTQFHISVMPLFHPIAVILQFLLCWSECAACPRGGKGLGTLEPLGFWQVPHCMIDWGMRHLAEP